MSSTPAGVSFSDPQHGWRLVPTAPPSGTAVGGPGAADIERTSDDGRTWQAVAAVPCGPGKPNGMGPTTVAARSSTSAWLLCTGGPATIMEDKSLATTTDGGATWQVRSAIVGGDPGATVEQIPISGHPTGLAIALDGTAWMWGDRMRPLVSRDAGRSWSDMPLGEIDVSPVTAASVLDAQRGYALVWDPNQQATLLEVTGDGGQIWSTRFSWPITEPNAPPPP